jgi:hypothetical protein
MLKRPNKRQVVIVKAATVSTVLARRLPPTRRMCRFRSQVITPLV